MISKCGIELVRLQPSPNVQILFAILYFDNISVAPFDACGYKTYFIFFVTPFHSQEVSRDKSREPLNVAPEKWDT